MTNVDGTRKFHSMCYEKIKMIFNRYRIEDLVLVCFFGFYLFGVSAVVLHWMKVPPWLSLGAIAISIYMGVVSHMLMNYIDNKINVSLKNTDNLLSIEDVYQGKDGKPCVDFIVPSSGDTLAISGDDAEYLVKTANEIILKDEECH